MTSTLAFPEALLEQAGRVLEKAGRAGMRIATVETCTGGLIGACLTAVPGASRIYERGFVLYHASAKATGLGVPKSVSDEHGMVSAPVTQGLAEGGLRESGAGICVSLTGYAGPGGGSASDPVGTIYTAVAGTAIHSRVDREVFTGGRDAIRTAGVGAALHLLEHGLDALLAGAPEAP